MKPDADIVKKLEGINDPQDLIKEVFTLFGDRAAIGTSGQLTGCVMIDMAFKAGITPRVFTIDTLRLFPETYALFDALEKKYSFKIEKVGPDPDAVRKMVDDNGEFLFFDSKEKQEHCCFIRKVEPNRRVLKTLDVWITGLRADQSGRRAATPRLQWIKEEQTGRAILKIAPLVDWTEAQLRAYADANGVPTHPLLSWEQNGWRYESLGCVICTTPISPFEPRRAGRWRWFNALDPSGKECGLHTSQPPADEDA